MMWLTIVENVLVAAMVTYSCRYFLHMLQLESYQLDGYARWLKKNREKLLGWTLNVSVIATIIKLLLTLLLGMFIGQNAANIAVTLLVLCAFGAAAWKINDVQDKAGEKKPLVYTPRMKRLCAATALVSLVCAMITSGLGIGPYITFAALAYIVYAAAYAMRPVEKSINDYYMNDARDILSKRDDLIKVGITGSFGKTSTKFILAAILSEKYDVLATPSSFNTPMGLTRVIREQLGPHHQVFLAEMGARHAGDILELCELVHPKYGVITSVGAQHLETFGDVETVANTKFELIESLPRDGVAFFAADGGYVDALFERAQCEKYRAGLGGGYLSMYAEDIKTGQHGSTFTLCDGEGARVKCRTRMLGRHNIENIVLSAMVARRLGLTMEEIARGIGKTQPVEHRLQLIAGAGGMTIIDDAFNSNPVGAKAALDVLRDFPGRRLIVTPGMVEQGEKEYELNFMFGQQLCGSCDEAILVGKKHTAPIYQGAISAGFDRAHIYRVSSLEEATGLLGQMGRPGDVVLFENDLPDNYAE